MKRNTLLIALLSLTVAFAGCTSGDGEVGGDDVQTGDDGKVELGNKGAISGFVVDDNYRPVQLKEEWSQSPGDFQDVGFVLLLETGQRFETNENGEFKILPLDPGTYTVRVAADVHEAKDTAVQVVAGEFAEVTVEARRQYSGGGAVLSQEYVVFIQCSANALYVGATNVACGDLSGDGQRAAFYPDYTAVKDDIRGMVTEMRAQSDGYYSVDIRTHELSCSSYSSFNGCLFGRADVENGQYIKIVNYPNKVWQRDGTFIEEGQEGYCTINDYDNGADGCGPYFAMTYDLPFQTILFPDNDNRYWIDQVYQYYDDPLFSGHYGIGPQLGAKAQFLQTVFLYELPEDGIDDFCALCDDAVLPE